MPQNTCEQCRVNQTIQPLNGKRARFCSLDCRKKFNQHRQVGRRRENNLQARLGLKGGTIGAINEALVAIDLIKRGWFVYRAFEPTHPFDMLIMKNGQQFRVEVKTETILPSGLRRIAMKAGQERKHDVLARVANLGEITYSPELPE